MKILCVAATTLLLFISLVSCKKNSFIESGNARVLISSDTIKFDTVFTSVGSVTKIFKVVNDNPQQLRLSSIKLMGGSSSPFRININGMAQLEASNIELAANDSLYVFVTVTVDPTAASLPFILSDSIRISYNGIERFVQLQAFGQNARFIRNGVILSDTHWTNDLPYVLLGPLFIDSTVVLTIEEGSRIYAHADAPIIIDGTLQVNGSKSANVIFSGDRLDEPYNNFPASWPGLIFRETSRNNYIRFAKVLNAYQAIISNGPSVNTAPKLIIQQSIIDNAYNAGLLCVNSHVEVNNSLISNCANNIIIQFGGTYLFTNCTAASYTTEYLFHSTPVATLNNFREVNGNISTSPLDARFQNCIFWGEDNNIENEVVVNRQGSSAFNVLFDHCLYRSLADPANSTITASIRNIDPLFDSIDLDNQFFNFRTTNPQAPGIDKGILTLFTRDLDDLNRNNGLPDLGAYEKQ